MDKYIQQLIEMMNAFGGKLNSSTPKVDDNIENYFEALERWIDGHKDPISTASEIDIDHLPPQEMLDDEQIRNLYNAMIVFLQKCGTHISLSLDIPIRDKYSIVRESWIEFDIQSTGYGRFVYDFCSGYAPDCILKEYCACKKFYEEDENDTLLTIENPLQQHEEIIDNFYTAYDDATLPRSEDGEILFDELWKNYEPIKYVTSRYVKQLVLDIEAGALNLHTSGTISILLPHDNGKVESVPPRTYRSIFEWLCLDPIAFPPFVQLSVYDADAISKALMNVFDDDFFNEFLPYQLFDKRYDTLFNYLSNEVVLESDDRFIMKPMTKDEWEAAAKKHNALFGGVIGKIDFKKGKYEDEDFDENGLPF